MTPAVSIVLLQDFVTTFVPFVHLPYNTKFGLSTILLLTCFRSVLYAVLFEGSISYFLN